MLYQGLLTCRECGLAPDLLVLQDVMTGAGSWGPVEKLGGQSFLGQLLDSPPSLTAANVKFYADKVKESGRRRRLRRGLARCRAGLDDSKGVDETTGRLEAILQGLRDEGTAELGDGFTLVEVASIPRQAVRWLWPDRLPLGKLALLAGDPNLGKSLLSLDVAARTSTGASWPDGAPGGDPGRVILLSAEDDVPDTIRPRLEAAGADLTRVLVIQGLKHFTLGHNLQELAKALRRHPDTKLVVIDPVSAFLGGTDSHVNAEVRGLLAPLVALAGRFGPAVLCITHLNKAEGGSPLYRAMGSLAFVAAPRVSWLVTKDTSRPSRFFFLPTKWNLTREAEATSLAYSIISCPDDPSVPVLAWEREPVTIRAEEALARPPKQRPRGKAVEFVREALADGPKPSRQLEQQARAKGISKTTFDRARVQLRVITFQQGRQWWSKLPEKEADIPSQSAMTSELRSPMGTGDVAT